jgi:hypothetical protein
MLAEQASACLVDTMPRDAEEYFSVVIEIDEGQDYADGSAPSCSKDILLKHTHPMFLLRLATEVDWSEETMLSGSLSGACCVLRRAPVGCRPWSAYPAPAISSDYYVPHERLKEDGAFPR